MGTATVVGRDELGRIIDVQVSTEMDVAPPGPETVSGGASGVGIFDYVQDTQPAGPIADGATWLRVDADGGWYGLKVYSTEAGWTEPNPPYAVTGPEGDNGTPITMQSGEGLNGAGGAVTLQGGAGTTEGGDVTVAGGAGDAADGGAVNIVSGNSSEGAAGNITIAAGSGDTGAGFIDLIGGGVEVALLGGNIILGNLPASDPLVLGALWVDNAASRVLKVSAGE